MVKISSNYWSDLCCSIFMLLVCFAAKPESEEFMLLIWGRLGRDSVINEVTCGDLDENGKTAG